MSTRAWQLQLLRDHANELRSHLLSRYPNDPRTRLLDMSFRDVKAAPDTGLCHYGGATIEVALRKANGDLRGKPHLLKSLLHELAHTTLALIPVGDIHGPEFVQNFGWLARVATQELQWPVQLICEDCTAYNIDCQNLKGCTGCIWPAEWRECPPGQPVRRRPPLSDLSVRRLVGSGRMPNACKRRLAVADWKEACGRVNPVEAQRTLVLDMMPAADRGVFHRWHKQFMDEKCYDKGARRGSGGNCPASHAHDARVNRYEEALLSRRGPVYMLTGDVACSSDRRCAAHLHNALIPPRATAGSGCTPERAPTFPPPLPWAAPPNHDPQRHEYTKRVVKAVNDSGACFDFVLYGDSIAAPPPAVFRKHFGDLKAAALGVPGDTVDELAWRITHGNELPARAPRVIAVAIGTDHVMRGFYDPKRVGDLLLWLKGAYPTSRLILWSLPPWRKPARAGMWRAAQPKHLMDPGWDKVGPKWMNGQARTEASRAGAVLATCGQEPALRAATYSDGMHPTAAGHDLNLLCLRKIVDVLRSRRGRT